jgi:hypothetical protein
MYKRKALQGSVCRTQFSSFAGWLTATFLDIDRGENTGFTAVIDRRAKSGVPLASRDECLFSFGGNRSRSATEEGVSAKP